MKNRLLTCLLFLTGMLVNSKLQAQVLRPFTPRYYNNSVRGNIVYVSNNILTSTGGITTEAGPGGTSVNNGKVGVNVDVDAFSSVTYIDWKQAWKYWDANTRPNNWEKPAFNDGAWLSGNAELGYGDGDEGKVISYGTNANIKYITAYFRKTVNIANPSAHTGFRLNIKYDDGFVVYVNGVEAGRGNMPTGAVGHGTMASSAIDDLVTTLNIPAASFVAGSNTIAVEIHQSGASSSDLSFDLQLTGVEDETFNSSTADLNLAPCSQVLWAGLYWGATQGTNGTNTAWITGEKTVKFKVPGAASYTTLTASQVDYHNGTLVPGLPHTGYRSFVDITALLNTTNTNGTFTVGNIATPAGIINTAGGWTIVVVYANPSEIPRNLTVFDGSAIMDGGSPSMNVPISGFLTPPSGPVSCELGAVVFDGDRVSQDEFSFKQNSNPAIGAYTNLTPNATSNLNDMWNSTISYKGANVTTRNPAHLNTLGYDADIMLVPNAGNAVLANNQTSASVRFSSPSENYFIQVLTTAISVFNPSFNLVKSSTDLNGGALNPGDVLQYRVEYSNVGNDTSINSKIIDLIPGKTSYKPGTLVINGMAKTDAPGDDEAEYDYAANRIVFRLGKGANATTGGQINTGGSGYVTFEVFTPTSCAVLACSNTISNSARMDYEGFTSRLPLYDSSGFNQGGCFVKGPVVNTVTGTCMERGDTSLVNQCPALTVNVPIATYGGYRFYSAMPFTSATLFDPYAPIAANKTVYGFYDDPGACDDTLQLRIYINECPDIDDDDDGIPDYVEGNGVNPSDDADGDGAPNFVDRDFPGFVDVNRDGVSDIYDADMDGVPNHLDLDSDNDGIPDVVESFGVDENGDGKIDNYTDPDFDGLSQNVDASDTGTGGSGNGLGAIDTDGDGVPNYFDLDSDNDGIPDVVEAYGSDANNDGRIDGYTDTDSDGYSDNVDGDVGNDKISENSGGALLRTGADTTGDGRTESFPFKNMDADVKPNPYDLDSDGDGITDVREAGLPDVNYNGQADGPLTADGWSRAASQPGGLPLPNTDGTGRVNVYDIDADDDGIPDNVEGMTTKAYRLPGNTDADGDGISDTYDAVTGFGGSGIDPANTDGDAYPDYLDSDTDSDGIMDRIEGNDFNLNKRLDDDDIALTGMDADDDGLDDKFDAAIGSTRGTSRYMGNNGTQSGASSPGSTTMVQQSFPNAYDRDWRYIGRVLDLKFTGLRAVVHNRLVTLQLQVICQQKVDKYIIERSTDGVRFSPVQSLAGKNTLQVEERYTIEDDLSAVRAAKVYYRVKATEAGDGYRYSPVVQVVPEGNAVEMLTLYPNPVRQQLQVRVYSLEQMQGTVYVLDMGGRVLYQQPQNLNKGYTTFTDARTARLPAGIYMLQLHAGGTVRSIPFEVQR